MPLSDEIVAHLEAEAKRLASHNPFYSDVLALIAEVRELRKAKLFAEATMTSAAVKLIEKNEILRAQLDETEAKYGKALQMSSHYRTQLDETVKVLTNYARTDFDDGGYEARELLARLLPTGEK